MKTLFNIFFISLFSFVSLAQENWDPTDHTVGYWQFRQVSEGDVANFLYNEDNVYRKLAAEAIKGGN